MLLVKPAHAASGDLDTSFGTSGKVSQVWPDHAGDTNMSSALQADGKILVADFNYFTRYSLDGALDTSFGTGGKVTFSNQFSIMDEAVTSNGQILLFGTFGSSPTDWAIFRLNIDGSNDTNFGSNGKQTIDIDFNDFAMAMITQSNGKVVLAGYSGPNSSCCTGYAFARINTDGTLDTSFGSGGKAVYTPINANARVHDLALQPDGKIVAAGDTWGTGIWDAMVAMRLNTNGTMDTTFGSGGYAVTDFGGDQAYQILDAVAVDSNGKIIATGHCWYTCGSNDIAFEVLRLNSNGTFDTSFDSDGKKTIVFTGSSSGSFAIIVQGTKYLVAGGVQNNTTFDQRFAIARLNASDGSLDSTFGSSGLVTTDFSNPDFNIAKRILLQGPAGKIVLSGHQGQNDNMGFALSRYLP